MIRTKLFRLSYPFLVLAMLPGGCVDASRPAEPVAPPLPPPTHALVPMTAAVEAGSYGRIEAIVVERGGERVYESYFRGSTRETQIDAKSVGKSITALAVGAAIDDGLLSGVNLPVWDYLTEGAPVPEDGPEKRAITIADLLSMSSPLACDDWYADSPGNEEKMYRRDDWTAFALAIPLDPAFTRFPNGQGRFSYCTAGAYLLGRVVERASGERFDAYVTRRLFAPLGIAPGRWRQSPTAQVQSGGQLALRAVDFAAVGRLVLNRGEVSGQHVVSRQWLREMLTPRVGVEPQADYAWLWWSVNLARPDGGQVPGLMARGNGGNVLLLVPDYDAVIVILSTSYNDDRAYPRSLDLIERNVLPFLAANPPGAMP